MEGIGIVINLYLIPHRIAQEEWEQVYQESLKLVEASNFMDRIEARRNGFTYSFARKSRDRAGISGTDGDGHGWLAVGALQTGERTGEFMLPRDIHACVPGKQKVEEEKAKEKDRGEDILLSALEGRKGIRKPKGCVNLWGQSTKGTDIHIYLLAIACLIADRFPQAAMVSGDISAGQCRKAVRWANQRLEKPIGMPVTGEWNRLLMRLRNSSLPNKYLLEAFYQLTDEAKGAEMGEFLRREFSGQELYEYYRQRFLPYQVSQRGFVRLMKEYLEMGFGFRELCRLAVTDPEGLQASPEEFLRRVLESKLPVKEKETFNFAGMARERADQEEADRDRELPAKIFCLLMGIENKNVDAYYPLEKIREDCKAVFDAGCQTDILIDRLLAEEERNSRRDSLQAILYDNPDGLFRQEASELSGGKDQQQPDRESYEVNSYRELAGFWPGCRMKPELEADLNKNFHALHKHTEQNFAEFGALQKEERENYLIQKTSGLLLREEVWDRIFERIMDDTYIERIYGILSVNRGQEDGELFCRSLFSNMKVIDYYWEKTIN